MENEELVVTLVDDDGNEKDFVVAEFIEIEDKKYAIVIPADCECEGECSEEECEEEDAYIFRVEIGEDGSEELIDIESEEEYEKVLDAIDEMDDVDIERIED